MARSSSGKLMALKVLCADVSSKPIDEIPELAIPSKLSRYIREAHITVTPHFQTIQDYFKEDGPNGSHLCLVSELQGPSIVSVSRFSLGRSGRVRGDLARKIAKQVACAVELMHSAGLVHGDITASNVLFRVNENVQKWSNQDVYRNFGWPKTEKVTKKHTHLPHHAPAYLTDSEPVTRKARFPNLSTFLQEDIVLVDFDQSFDSSHPPSDYAPGTVLYYQSPECVFEKKIGMPADIWGLACTIFEIRAGYPLFDPFIYNEAVFLMFVVATLGKFPEKWWDKYEHRHLWFGEDGQPKAKELQPKLFPVEKMSIKQDLENIGANEAPAFEKPSNDKMECNGTRLDELEIQLLGDLLEKMLRYQPEDRINIGEVISHPWFSLE